MLLLPLRQSLQLRVLCCQLFPQRCHLARRLLRLGCGFPKLLLQLRPLQHRPPCLLRSLFKQLCSTLSGRRCG